MGNLTRGTPLRWKDAAKYAEHVRKHGIVQLLNILQHMKEKNEASLLWGDEVEYMLVKFDEETKTVKLDLRALALVDTMSEDERAQRPVDVLWRPEYGRYMLEATPAFPYGSRFVDLLRVESNMRLRRTLISIQLDSSEHMFSLTNFPLLGVGQFTSPAVTADGEAAHSLFISDDCINTHPRFPTLTANIRERRGSKVEINVPIFKDKNTPSPFVEALSASRFGDAPAQKPDHIYMDCMCFGMGCCCLQVTFQAFSLDEARRLYDQLLPFAPIMLALTAASPYFRGYLAERDCRWDVISASVDDRTEEERGLKPLTENHQRIYKSRYASLDSYLSAQDGYFRPEYNDIPLVVNEGVLQVLKENGLDETFAQHFAHLYIRDPLVIYEQGIEQDDHHSSDHFENIQSTNWQTLRFKPPPPGSDIGWRVEFRSMEVQLTDYENAAFTIFIVLLTRAILSLHLNFYMPISKVDKNMETAQVRNARLDGKFYFRKDAHSDSSDASNFEELSLDEIINGKPGTFPGALKFIHSFLDSSDVDVEVRCVLNRYLGFISKRASGKLHNFATWARNFVTSHPSYKQDSVVQQDIAFDLLKKCRAIEREEEQCPEMFGNYLTQRK